MIYIYILDGHRLVNLNHTYTIYYINIYFSHPAVNGLDIAGTAVNTNQSINQSINQT